MLSTGVNNHISEHHNFLKRWFKMSSSWLLLLIVSKKPIKPIEDSVTYTKHKEIFVKRVSIVAEALWKYAQIWFFFLLVQFILSGTLIYKQYWWKCGFSQRKLWVHKRISWYTCTGVTLLAGLFLCSWGSATLSTGYLRYSVIQQCKFVWGQN